jgi:IS5 family transposase
MLQPNDKTSPFLLQTEQQVFNKIIEVNHPFRRLKEIIDFEKFVTPLRSLYSDLGTSGIAIEKGFLALLIQFWEDYSDREMEKCVKENMAVRWFAGFGLLEQTPDHTYFCKLRKRIGAQKLYDIFTSINKHLESLGLVGNVFTFIDASSIITKTALWDERDKAIADGAEKLNNKNVTDYAADKDARFGAKGKNKIWFGYKRHEAVDMRYGIITKLTVTAANVPDYKTTNSICPKQGMVFSDKLFDCKENNNALKAHNLHAGTIRKNNNKSKNRDLDRWVSAMRMPFESTFSKCRKRAKFRGRAKVFFQATFEAMCHNLKKALVVLPIPIQTSP